MNAHKTIKMNLGGMEEDIDAGIVELIRVLNSILGVETFTSCQGGNQQFPDGYVMFQRSGERGTNGNLIRFLQTMTELMDAAWGRYGRRMSRYYNLHGEHPRGADFHFSVSMGDGYVMRWAPQTYPDVLKAAKVAKVAAQSLKT